MNRLQINTNDKKSKINKNIYGHFAEHLGRCIYDGLYVGENPNIEHVNGMRADVVEALRHIKIPVLRWPGGCFADSYHWKDGIGEKSTRKKMVNTHWGGVTEDNSFGTHEFMELCRQLGCEPYINGNMGSGTVQEMSEWVEYLTFGGVSSMSELREANGQKDAWRVKYWGVGNENWGCGGNMRPEFYADQYRRYATYIRSFGENKIYKIACGSHDDNYEWTETVMKLAGRYMDAFTLHYYTIPGEWSKKGSATDFTEEEYNTTIAKAVKIKDYISNHLQIMNRYDPEHRVGLIIDEWGTWYDVEPGTNPGFLYQQNTMRDAMVAALSFNIFNGFADRVVMANIAQTLNVLQSVILTEGAQMLLTPTYHVFDLYKKHQEATAVYSAFNEATELSASASLNDAGLFITLVNPSAGEAFPVELALSGFEPKRASARILSGGIRDHNTFDEPNKVKIAVFEGIDRLRLSLPPCSVVAVELLG